MTRAVLLACFVTWLGVAAPDASAAQPAGNNQQLNIELVKALDAQGGYIRLEGQSLFLTSDIKKASPGYWFDLAANPRSPSLVSDSLPGGWDIALAGNSAFLCDYTKFFTVFDTSDHHWKQITRLEMPSTTENVLIRDKLAYVANHVAGMMIVDISKPSKPSIVSNFNPQIDCDAIGLWHDTAILYGHWESRLVLVDISDPANPRQTGLYQNAPKTFNQGELAVDGGFAYCTALTGLVIVNIADPANPKLAKSVELPSRTTDVVVQDGYAFIAAGPHGVRVYDVHTPNNPKEVGYYKHPRKFAAAQLAVQRVADENEYYIYVANAKGPATLLLFKTPTPELDSK